MGGGEANLFAGALVRHDHVALELPGADADEGDAVAVLRVHVGLDLEDEARELGVRDRQLPSLGRGRRARRGHGDGAARGGRDGFLEKTLEQELHAEVVHRGAEEAGRLLAGVHGGEIERGGGAVEHGDLLGDLGVGEVVEFFAHLRVLEAGDVYGRAEGAAGHALKEVDLRGAAVEHAAEAGAVTERPGNGAGGEAEHALEFVD